MSTFIPNNPKAFINCKRQAPNLGKILCKSSFSSWKLKFRTKKLQQKFACYQYINEGIEHTFKTVSKKFEIRVPFNCESKEFNLHRNFQWLQGRIYRAITANRCPEAYKDMWWWKFQNYASLCSLARRQNLKRVIWDIFYWKIETRASAETVVWGGFSHWGIL